MVYHRKFIASVKCNGRILREYDNETVYLPFGSEYSLLLKNLDTTRAVVSVSIDGEDVLSGHRLVVEPNSTFELEGFLDADQKVKNAFKFIERTEKISQHRGERVDDGIIRIEYQFEKSNVIIHYDPGYHEHHHHHHHYHHYHWHYHPWCSTTYGSISNTCGSKLTTHMNNLTSGGGTATIMNYNMVTEGSSGESYGNDIGITVRGSERNQQCSSVCVGALSEPYVIVLRLRGETSKGKVAKPLTVKTKLTCSTCGTKNKSGSKYCVECGTFLL